MFTRPPLLLIHGFPLDATLWEPQVRALSPLVEVIAPDLRGFGNDRRELPAIMPMRSHAADLKEMLDERGIEKVILCGLSMGGYIAMAFAERWPERLAGLILCNTRSNADDEDGVAARHTTAQNAREKGMDVIARGMLPGLLTERTRQERPELAQHVLDMIARQSPDTVAATSLGMAQRPDRLHVLQKMKVPALVITGDSDSLMPMPTSQVMADALPNGRLVVLPGAAHLTNMEVPELFNRTIQIYLEEHHHA
ncbi:MAG: alpha/beta fold hydrolase [Flavobacteriales bacterium]|nr:alpha/beta fold hydrolase [Flavobacteriales bacterium]